jgi:hypothetical protein
MIPAFMISSVGMVAGVAAFLLGVAQLTCEHARSALLPRLTTFTLTILAGWTAIDSWDAWSGVRGHVDAKAVAFAVALALSWGYRRAFGLTTQRR